MTLCALPAWAGQLTWASRVPELINSVNAIGFADGEFVAVGSMGTAWRSPDGTSWTARELSTFNSMRDLCRGAGLWVGVGETMTVGASVDGSDWWTRSGGSGGTPEGFRGCAYGNGRFVAVGDLGTIATSTTGTNWVRLSVGGGVWRDVVFANGQFVVVGTASITSSTPQRPAVITSSDGATWPTPPLTIDFAGSSLLTGIAYGNGTHVAVSGTTIYTSQDAVTWTPRLTGLTNFLRGVAFANGGFLAYGGSGSLNTSGVLLGSADGLGWADASAEPIPTLFGIAYGMGSYVAVGVGAPNNRGYILQSQPIAPGRLSARTLGAGGTEIAVDGEAGRSYQLEASSTMPSDDWLSLATFVLPGPSTNYLDPRPGNLPAQFYRLSSE